MAPASPAIPRKPSMRGAIELTTANVERSGSVKSKCLLVLMRMVWALDVLLYILLLLPFLQVLDAGAINPTALSALFVVFVMSGIPLEGIILRLHDKEIRMKQTLSEREERYYNDIYIAPDDLKSQFFSLVGEMGWWIGFTMDFVLLMSTIAHTGSADTDCWTNVFFVYFAQGVMTFATLPSQDSERSNTDGVFLLLYLLTIMWVAPLVACAGGAIGTCIKSRARKRGETFERPHINLKVCNFFLAFSMPISLLLRSNDINYRVILACSDSSFPDTTKKKFCWPLRAVDPPPVTPRKRVRFEYVNWKALIACFWDVIKLQTKVQPVEEAEVSPVGEAGEMVGVAVDTVAEGGGGLAVPQQMVAPEGAPQLTVTPVVPQQVVVQVPPGFAAGFVTVVQGPSGPFSVVIPEGVAPGQQFIALVPVPAAAPAMVPAPPMVPATTPAPAAAAPTAPAPAAVPGT
ncbi:hypothetical protein TeGR_g7704 [Tetraparma gracilis]|uniref:Uncharacterized protein n=1 Tax=Tetraparma gracilis TaxID=2962635 RepID=A0ABQ6MV03_9STRA|nr:hypothetical protein TeGR_g7704 [Tetraparma gracilis]